MDLILYLLFRGLIIGILVSAPMGPVGVLCIQRTLNKGRWAGFYTGIGAAFSDVFYCLLTGLGLSFIIDFIETNQSLLQMLGSIVLVFFGFYLIKKNPAGTLKTPKDRKMNYTQDFVTGFLFTFSNPLILFLIIGLFTRFNFLSPDYEYYHYIVGFTSIFAGAILWWFVVTFFVNAVRSHFNVRSMWLINRIIGIIILLMSLFGFIMGLKEYILVPGVAGA